MIRSKRTEKKERKKEIVYQAFLRSLGSGYQSQSFLILTQVFLFKIFNFDRFYIRIGVLRMPLFGLWTLSLFSKIAHGVFLINDKLWKDGNRIQEVLKCFVKFELLEFNL